jgi:hypothetical protein
MPSQALEKTMTKVSTVLMLFVFSSSLLAQSAGPVETTITKLEKESIEAALKGDASWGEKYDADDYVGIGQSGTQGDKKTSLDSLRSGRTKYEKIELKDLKITQYGPNTAIARGTAYAKGTTGGQDFDGQYAYSRVWVKRNGKWQVVSFQVTKM